MRLNEKHRACYVLFINYGLILHGAFFKLTSFIEL